MSKQSKAKTTLTALLAALLLTSCASGGASGGGSDTGGGEAPSTTAEVAETTTTAKPEYEAPDIDLKDAEFMVYVWTKDSNWKLASYTGVFAEAENGDPINDAVVQRNRAVRDALGVIIKEKKDSAVTVLTNSLLAGEDTYKLVLPVGSTLKTLLGYEGMFLDLSKAENLDLTKSWWDQNANDEFTIGGAQYVAQGDINLYGYTNMGVLFFNKSMIST